MKLIAEPWDVGPDGYQLGRFPPGWAEWNGAFRDCVRRFWRGDPGMVPELASRLTGSSDIYAPSGRRTYASVNFVTCHDGFTLSDLVGFEERHNEANGEGNRDGAGENYSWNWGVEGRTDSHRIFRARERIKRNMLATLFFSQGVRMLPRRRRDRPEPAGQQQRLLPGQRDQLAELEPRRVGPRPPRLHPGADPDLQRQPRPAPPGLLQRPALHPGRHQGRHLDPTRRRGDDRGRMVRP